MIQQIKNLMSLIVMNFILVTLISAGPVRRANQDPTVDEPKMPGSGVLLKEVNPAPNPAPGHNKSEKFRGTLLKSKESREKQEVKEERDNDVRK